MKNSKKKILALCLALVLALSLLCGCTIQTPEEVAAEAAGTGTAAQVASPSSSEVVNSATEEDYYDVGDAAGMDEAEYEKYKTATGGDNSGGSAHLLQQDKYSTDPVPDGMPLPVEYQDVEIDEGTALTCTLYVDCSTILANKGKLKAGKEEVLPADGIVYAKATVTFYKGESVFDVLLRETQKNRIHMEYEMTPGYNSNYLEGIGNLYEYDCGELSGWLYSVNGWYPNYGCSRYQLEDGDAIEWKYTCDLGRDLGVDWIDQR